MTMCKNVELYLQVAIYRPSWVHQALKIFLSLFDKACVGQNLFICDIVRSVKIGEKITCILMWTGATHVTYYSLCFTRAIDRVI